MHELIYLDNAATSHPKPEAVYLAMDAALRRGASPGRGGHQQALSAERMVFEAREALADFFNADNSEQFVFTPNATLAINLALFGLLLPGDRVVTTCQEHNAVSRPLRALQDRGVSVVKVPAGEDGVVSAAALKQACLQDKTRLLVMNHCSNVYGAFQPVEDLGPWCREQGILFMVDGSQSAGCLPIDFQALQVDLFAAPGHKGLLGPQGTGFLYVRKGLQLTPLIYGGTGGSSHSDLPPEHFPERLECGTLNTPGLAGLKAALGFLQQVGVDKVRAHELQAIEKLLVGLRAIPGVKVYGPESALNRGAAISFNLVQHDPAEVGFLLDQNHKICLRVGLHCAPDAHRAIGTYPGGTVRVSPGYFTTQQEIDTFLAAVDAFAQKASSR